MDMTKSTLPFKTYLVGGAVRDSLLGLEVHERDWVVVGATPEAMLAAGYKPVGKDFPVFLHPESAEEYALARTERKSGTGYKGFTVYAEPSVSLEEDLLRRDLTINAIAQDEAGNIIDPYGGVTDLEQRVLRHVSEAFCEDPLRVLRVARFSAKLAAFGFRLAPETAALLRQMVRSGELADLVPERVWLEFEKTLAYAQPQHFFTTLRQVGALAELFPELDNMFGVPNPPQYHPEIDSGVHTMMVLQQAVLLSDDASVRFAALVHDLGKALTPACKWPSHHGHEEAGVASVQAFCERYPVPKQWRELALLVTQYHGKIHKAMELRAATMVDLLQSLDAFRRPQRFRQCILAALADSRGRPGFEDEAYPQQEILEQAYQAAVDIDIAAIVEMGYSGEQIAEQVRQQRIAKVKATLASAPG